MFYVAYLARDAKPASGRSPSSSTAARAPRRSGSTLASSGRSGCARRDAFPARRRTGSSTTRPGATRPHRPGVRRPGRPASAGRRGRRPSRSTACTRTSRPWRSHPLLPGPLRALGSPLFIAGESYGTTRRRRRRPAAAPPLPLPERPGARLSPALNSDDLPRRQRQRPALRAVAPRLRRHRLVPPPAGARAPGAKPQGGHGRGRGVLARGLRPGAAARRRAAGGGAGEDRRAARAPDRREGRGAQAPQPADLELRLHLGAAARPAAPGRPPGQPLPRLSELTGRRALRRRVPVRALRSVGFGGQRRFRRGPPAVPAARPALRQRGGLRGPVPAGRRELGLQPGHQPLPLRGRQPALGDERQPGHGRVHGERPLRPGDHLARHPLRRRPPRDRPTAAREHHARLLPVRAHDVHARAVARRAQGGPGALLPHGARRSDRRCWQSRRRRPLTDFTAAARSARRRPPLQRGSPWRGPRRGCGCAPSGPRTR